MKNPCDLCIVKACCGTICKEKYCYSDYLDHKLRNMWPHLFSLNGHPRKHIPATIKKERDAYTKRAEKHYKEMNILIERNAPIV